MPIFILILSVITHGWCLEWLNSPLAPTFNCLVCNSVLSTPPQTAFLGGFWSLHKTDAVLVPWSRKCSPFFCFLVPLAASTPSGRGEPQDSAAERCEQFISRNYPDLRPLPAWRPQQKLIFLENPSDLETQEMNPVPRVAAESLGFEPRLRPSRSSSGSRISVFKGKKTGHVCVGSAWGRLQEPHVCTIKSWLPPEGSQRKLKEAGPCRKPNKGQLGFFFFFNLQAFRSCLEPSLLDVGLARHSQFP